MNISSDSELKKCQTTLAKYIYFWLVKKKKATWIHVFFSTLTNYRNKIFSVLISYFDCNPGKVQFCRHCSPLAQAVAAQLQPYEMVPFPGCQALASIMCQHVFLFWSMSRAVRPSDQVGTSIFNSELLPKVLKWHSNTSLLCYDSQKTCEPLWAKSDGEEQTQARDGMSTLIQP